MGTGPWKLEKYTPNVGVNYIKNPDYWDKTRQPLPDRNEIKFYEKEEAAILGMQGDEVDVLAQFSAGQRQGAAHRPEHHRDRAARLAAPPAAHAHRQGAVQRQARAPGGGAPDQPRQHRQGPARGEVGLRQRQPVRARLPVDRQVGRRSASRTSRRPRRCWRRPARATSASSCAAGTGSRCRSTPQLDPERPQGGGHQRQAQHHRRRQLLRRRGVRQVALAGLDVRHHRVRAPRGAERVPRRAAQERRHLELRPLQEQGVRQARRRSTSRRSTCSPSARRRRRSRRCCSTRCRSSSPTSTST